MLEVENITKKFRTDFWKDEFFALNDVSFSIIPGEITGFLGANGAGKTTLIKIILGFISPTSGTTRWGIESKREKIFGEVGYMPERPYYYQHLTGMEFLSYCGEICKLPKSDIVRAIDVWSQKLKIDFALNRKIKSYSKGMLQRLGFVATLLHDPKVIILDEPLAGLDPIGRKEFKDVILELRSLGKTIFFSSHIVTDVEEISDNLVVLDKGNLVYSGKLENIFESNQSEYIDICIKNSGLTLEEFEQYIYSRNSEHLFLKIPNEKKPAFLQTLVGKGVDLVSLYVVQPSLEEVIYRIKK